MTKIGKKKRIGERRGEKSKREMSRDIRQRVKRLNLRRNRR